MSVPYNPSFCIASDHQPLEVAEGLLHDDPRVDSMRREHSRLWLRGPLQEVLRVRPKRMRDTWAIATDLRKRTKTTGFLFFDVDHAQECRWMHEQGLWSMCRLQAGPQGPLLQAADDDDRWSVEYPDPKLRCLRLVVRARQLGHEPSFGDPLEAIELGDARMVCTRPGDPQAERKTLRRLGERLRRLDPDVLLTQHGDRFDVPYLLTRIRKHGLQNEVWLGRAPDPDPDRPDQESKSIHTYGRWLFKTHAYYLRGRWHIDLAKKTLDSEDDRKDVHGIVYLARVANRRAQDVNRNGAGFALQQMQIDLAADWGVALPWKRNLVEEKKDAETLGAVDRGGQIMVPTPGIYEDVVACDYSGYYPSLVVRHNLSSDSMNCSCCPDGPVVPELGYHVCQRMQGHQSEILKRLWPHRRWAKAVLRKANSIGGVEDNLIAKAKAIKSEHKALGVVCFGYFRYRNARFGCAEVHQAIQCYGRAGMTRARELAQAEGFRMVHALTDCMFLQRAGVTRPQALQFARRVTNEVGVPMDVEGVYRWVVFLPSKVHSTTSQVGVPNRYYGKFEDGSLKVRGIEVQRHITASFLYDVQQAQLDIFQQADDREGFLALIPRALKVAKEAAGRLRRREVNVEDLGLVVQTRMSVEEYRSNTGTKAALRRLRDAGTERKPGEFVKYVITRTEGPWIGRTVPVELLKQKSPWFEGVRHTYDVDAYLRLLARQVETLLSPFGYTEDALYNWFAGRSRRPYLDLPPRKKASGRGGPTGGSSRRRGNPDGDIPYHPAPVAGLEGGAGWSQVLKPVALTLLHGTARDLRGFFQELANVSLHGQGGNVLWYDSEHGFNPHDFAELNLTRGFAAETHAERMLIRRCLTPFQWYTSLSRHLPQDLVDAETALAIVNPFHNLWSTDELADWEQEDYVRFIVPHLQAVAKKQRVPILLGVDMNRWWRAHPTLAQITHDGVDVRWSVTDMGDRWRVVRDDGTVLDPLLPQRVTLLDYLGTQERKNLLLPMPVAARGGGERGPWRTRIVHPTPRRA